MNNNNIQESTTDRNSSTS